jgi:hypothetical protein
MAYIPFNASWLNRIEAQFTGLRYSPLDGTDHPTPSRARDPPLHRRRRLAPAVSRTVSHTRQN